MKDNSIDLSKSKDSKEKKNNSKIGKKEKRPELIFFTKYLMIVKERSDNIKKQNNKSLDKKNKTKLKLKEELDNTKLDKMPEGKPNLRDLKLNKVNFFNKLLKSRKREDLFCYNYKNNNKKWKAEDKTIAKKYRKEKDKEESNSKISKKPLDFIDSLIFLSVIIT